MARIASETTDDRLVCLAIRCSSCQDLEKLTLDVTKAGNGTGTVTSDPAGINCGTDCSEAYTPGTTVVLTATPTSGSVFIGWSGACKHTNPDCQVVMNSDKSVTAHFSSSSIIFNDVSSGHWAYWYINALYNNGITVGCGGGNYCPEDSVTRDQMAAFYNGPRKLDNMISYR